MSDAFIVHPAEGYAQTPLHYHFSIPLFNEYSKEKALFQVLFPGITAGAAKKRAREYIFQKFVQKVLTSLHDPVMIGMAVLLPV
ncbi:MAG TPA: hypothetical protein VKR83_14120 [Ktedonobacteraceae bacterium]|nr:hypothetical protein [Ktedonobacteraceae bacterium]